MSEIKSLPDHITTTTFTCLCRRITVPATLAKYAALPIPSVLCHCDSCRHQSGAVAAMLCELGSAPPQDALDLCASYAFSKDVTRYFCEKCGSNMFIEERGPTAALRGQSTIWLGWAGVLRREDQDDVDVDTAKAVMQVFVGDTRDGGLFKLCVDVAKGRGEFEGGDEGSRPGAGLLRSVFRESWNGPRLASLGDIKDFMTEIDRRLRIFDTDTQQRSAAEKLLAKCHCGAVRFYITRPNRENNNTYAEQVQTKLIKADYTKWISLFCACSSCRTATGLPLTAWAYVPPEHITTIDGKPIDFGHIEGLSPSSSSSSSSSSSLPGIKKYQRQGDQDVTRSFCGTCGATIFYEHAQRAWAVDVSVGILRSERGVMAEDFIEWNLKYVSWREECRFKELLEGTLPADGE